MFARQIQPASLLLILSGVFGGLFTGCSNQAGAPPDSLRPIASAPDGSITPASLGQTSGAVPIELGISPDAASVAESAYSTAWPVAIDAADGRIELYQPQPDSLNGDELKARAAVSLTRPGATEPVFGAVWFTARILTDRDARTVTLTGIAIRHLRLANATAGEDKQFAADIAAQLPQRHISFPLDELMTSLDLARREQVEKQSFSTTPPKIVFSTVPSTLISVHGPPALRPVTGVSGAQRVVNTPFIMLFDPETKRYYLKAGARWMTAAEVGGPWDQAKEVSAPITAAGVELAGPATRPVTGPQAAGAGPLADLVENVADTRIIVAIEPTELVVTEGDPKFAPLSPTPLFYLSNTQSNVFLDPADKRYYVLLSGRWFASASLQGPWTYIAADKMPAAFAAIPSDSPRAGVLPFVAGTAEAHEAVLDASIPQTAAISRDAGKDMKVPYDGEPKFEPIQGTSMTYAANSPDAVIHLNDGYYCCFQGVWYDSGSPGGPWTVCVAVPPEIYTIPPTCPLYNVTYAHVYDFYPDVAYVGYQPGYLNSYVDGPTVVYGTGYDYPGYLGEDDYIAPFCTWGFGACYDPWTCGWGFGFGYGWGADWFVSFDHHRHDHDHMWGYHHWWGDKGFVSFHHLEQVHATGVAADVHAARFSDHVAAHVHNLYQRSFNARHVASAAPAELARPGAVGSRESARDSNNIYAGHDGSIYRRNETGAWEQRGVTGWEGLDRIPEARPAYRPAPAPVYHPYINPSAGMERSYNVRAQGAERSSGFHGGGGGFHGGGRR